MYWRGKQFYDEQKMTWRLFPSAFGSKQVFRYRNRAAQGQSRQGQTRQSCSHCRLISRRAFNWYGMFSVLIKIPQRICELSSGWPDFPVTISERCRVRTKMEYSVGAGAAPPRRDRLLSCLPDGRRGRVSHGIVFYKADVGSFGWSSRPCRKSLLASAFSSKIPGASPSSDSICAPRPRLLHSLSSYRLHPTTGNARARINREKSRALNRCRRSWSSVPGGGMRKIW